MQRSAVFLVSAFAAAVGLTSPMLAQSARPPAASPTTTSLPRTPEGTPIPPNTLAELKRDMERRRFICDQIRKIERARIERLERAPNTGPSAMVRLLARVIGIGIETADLLVHEVLLRNLRDRRAVARYGG